MVNVVCGDLGIACLTP
ncbi:DUF3265 domain-containing protein [Vibrio alginolyticus]|nr:DUF3265 domain-containing protein [Vibrio alginolyticus]